MSNPAPIDRASGSRSRCSPRPSSSSCSTRRSSTSRCRRSAATSTSPRTTCRGSSTPTRSSSAASCCSAGAWPTCSAAGACSSPASILFAAASLAGGLAQSDGLADRRPRRPGPRRRAALPGRAVARHHDLRRGRRAQQGAGRLGRGRRLRRRRRRAARRHAHRVRRLGVGAVRQRADRPRRRAARAAPAAREPQRRARATSTSPARSRSPPACRCSSTRSSTPTTPAGARPQTLGLVARRARAARARSWSIELRSKAPLVPFADLPHAHATGANVVGAAGRDGAVLDVLLHLALHAAGARLRRARRPASPTCRWRSGSSSRPASRRSW